MVQLTVDQLVGLMGKLKLLDQLTVDQMVGLMGKALVIMYHAIDDGFYLD